MLGRDFWTQTTQINILVFREICVVCILYGVTRV
jgi:hypothetical protein